MSTYLVTGSTGFIGGALCKLLANNGHQVRALCRDVEKANSIFQHHNIQAIKGDLNNTESLIAASKNCEGVFHLAAFAKVWSPKPETFYKVNVEGTIRLLEACVLNSVPRVVITSTAGVFGPAITGKVDETSVPSTPPSTQYERSKKLADEKAEAYLDKLNIVWLHPTRVFGPGELTESNAATKLIKMRWKGKMKFVPGNGNQLGNYVFVEDVAQAQLLAMIKGKSTEHYIIGAENMSYRDFYQTIDALSGKQSPIWKLPLWLMKTFAHLEMIKAKVLGLSPLISPAFVDKYNYNWSLSSAKAKRDLGYNPLGIEEGIKRTLHWLKEEEKEKDTR